jgi:hypothetical protein
MGSISIFTAFYMVKLGVFIIFFTLMKVTPLKNWKKGQAQL